MQYDFGVYLIQEYGKRGRNIVPNKTKIRQIFFVSNRIFLFLGEVLGL